MKSFWILNFQHSPSQLFPTCTEVFLPYLFFVIVCFKIKEAKRSETHFSMETSRIWWFLKYSRLLYSILLSPPSFFQVSLKSLNPILMLISCDYLRSEPNHPLPATNTSPAQLILANNDWQALPCINCQSTAYFFTNLSFFTLV